MKSPLIYQMTENSCGATAVLNCINVLFDRQEMPNEFLRILLLYSINCYDEIGNFEENEFSESFSFFVSSWINDYALRKKIPLKAKLLKLEDVNLLEIKKCLSRGGVITLKSADNKNNYVVITNMDGENIYIFDPVYADENQFKTNQNIVVENNQPFLYNRKVKIEYFIRDKNEVYTLGNDKNREAILFFRNDTIKQREFD